MKYTLTIETDSPDELADLVKAGLPKAAKKATVGDNRAAKANSKSKVEPTPEPVTEPPKSGPTTEPSKNGKPEAELAIDWKKPENVEKIRSLLTDRVKQHGMRKMSDLMLDKFEVNKFSQVPLKLYDTLYGWLEGIGDTTEAVNE